MTGPDMATITASLERSLQNFSLNHHHHHHGHHHDHHHQNYSVDEDHGDEGISRTSSSDLQQHITDESSQQTYELNSHVSLPYHWERCLDLKTGELYYLNWRTGMKTKEIPRMGNAELGYEIYSEEEDESEYDSEGSTTESSASSSRDKLHNNNNNNNNNRNNDGDIKDQVLVVAGCKRCLMYFMVPKTDGDCPKCCAQLLHFDK